MDHLKLRNMEIHKAENKTMLSYKGSLPEYLSRAWVNFVIRHLAIYLFQ